MRSGSEAAAATGAAADPTPRPSRVAPEDVAACEERFNKSKLVHSIMRHVAETTGSDLNVRVHDLRESGVAHPR